MVRVLKTLQTVYAPPLEEHIIFTALMPEMIHF